MWFSGRPGHECVTEGRCSRTCKGPGNTYHNPHLRGRVQVREAVPEKVPLGATGRWTGQKWEGLEVEGAGGGGEAVAEPELMGSGERSQDR